MLFNKELLSTPNNDVLPGCFTEKQHDLSIFMPPWQAHLGRTYQSCKITRPQIYSLLLFLLKTFTSCWSVHIFHHTVIPRLLLLIRPSDFIFQKILSVLKHCDDHKIFILARSRFPFHLPAFEATFIKNFNPTFCRQKEFAYSLKIVH